MTAWTEGTPWTCRECGTRVFDDEAPCHGCNLPDDEITVEQVDPETVRRYAEIGEAA